MKLHTYSSLEQYIQIQTEANKKKINSIWVSEGNVRMVRNHFRLPARSVLCHGTRNAEEQKLFRVAWPDAEIIGTEISDNARDFPLTVQWDFHEPNPKWLGKFDVVYSNAFDHSYDPVRCLETWLAQLAAGGRLYVDFADDPRVNYCSETDPLELDRGDMTKLVRCAGGRVVAHMDGKSAKGHHTTIYVIQAKAMGR